MTTPLRGRRSRAATAGLRQILGAPHPNRHRGVGRFNQGNSGGPLVNLSGQVVGINSAIATGGPSTGSIGLGFAIPVDHARRVAQEILDTGSATKPAVQGTPRPATGPSPGWRWSRTVHRPRGPGSAAGDVVTRVRSFTDLVARIGSHAPATR